MIADAGARDCALQVGGHIHAAHERAMTCQDLPDIARGGTDNPQGAVATTDQDEATVVERLHGPRLDAICVERTERFACERIPHSDGIPLRGRDDAFSIPKENARIYLVRPDLELNVVGSSSRSVVAWAVTFDVFHELRPALETVFTREHPLGIGEGKLWT